MSIVHFRSEVLAWLQASHDFTLKAIGTYHHHSLATCGNSAVPHPHRSNSVASLQLHLVMDMHWLCSPETTALPQSLENPQILELCTGTLFRRCIGRNLVSYRVLWSRYSKSCFRANEEAWAMMSLTRMVEGSKGNAKAGFVASFTDDTA